MRIAAIVEFVLAVLAAAIAFAAFFTGTRRAARPEIALESPAQIARPDPLEFEPGRTEEYEQAAAFGLSHVLFEKSPGGAIRAAQRTARFRAMVDKATSGTGIDPDLVEAIVLLESAGRQDVIAGDDPANAAGLTQIVAETATRLSRHASRSRGEPAAHSIYWTRRSVAATTPRLLDCAPSAGKPTRASILNRRSPARCAT